MINPFRLKRVEYRLTTQGDVLNVEVTDVLGKTYTREYYSYISSAFSDEYYLVNREFEDLSDSLLRDGSHIDKRLMVKVASVRLVSVTRQEIKRTVELYYWLFKPTVEVREGIEVTEYVS